MEHRNGKRIQTSMPVELWSDGKCLGYYQSQDVGLGGLSLVGVTQDFREGIFLKVKVYSELNSSESELLPSALHCERKAMVISRGENRLSLMWADENTDFAFLLKSKTTSIAKDF